MVCSMLLESLSCSSFTVLPDPVWVLLIYVFQNIPLSLHNSKSLKLLELCHHLFWYPLCSNYKTPPRGAPGGRTCRPPRCCRKGSGSERPGPSSGWHFQAQIIGLAWIWFYQIACDESLLMKKNCHPLGTQIVLHPLTLHTRISSHLGAKLHDWAAWQAGAGC